MTQRTLVHVAGPRDAGKTTFIERLLDAEVALAICVRAERDAKLRTVKESRPRAHAELRRYRDAGAVAVARYRFAEPDFETFYMSDVMEEYSEAVFIEGDWPVDFVDLSVFVAPVLPKGRSLLRRAVRDRAAAHEATRRALEQAPADPEAMSRYLGAALGEHIAKIVLTPPTGLDHVRGAIEAKRGAAPTEHWAIAEGHEGIQRAHLVVVNVRSEEERASAAALVDDVARLRKDEAVFRDVLGFRGTRTPVTALVADLSNPKDAGTRKALARVKRSTKRSRE